MNPLEVMLSKDFRALVALNKAPVIQIIPGTEYTGKIGSKTPLYVHMSEYALGYGAVESVSARINRSIKRLAGKKRFWLREELTTKVCEQVSNPTQSEKSFKASVSKKISDLIKDGYIDIVV